MRAPAQKIACPKMNIALQAIVTRWVGPSNTMPDRIVAQCRAKRRIYSVHWLREYAENPQADVHDIAAQCLAAELGWLDNHALVTGGMPDTYTSSKCYVLLAKGSVIA